MDRKFLSDFALLSSTSVSALFVAAAFGKMRIAPPVLLCCATLLLLINGLIWFLHKKTSSELSTVGEMTKSLAQGKPLVTLDVTQQLASQVQQIIGDLQTASTRFNEMRRREQSLLENAQDVICMLDLKGIFRSVTPASKAVLGYRPDELQGKELTNYLVQDDVDQTLNAVLGAENSINRIAFENKFKKPNGEIVELLWSAHWSASDRGLFCVARDNTDRKRAELALQESEARTRYLMNHMPAALLVLSSDGRVSFQNARVQEITGKSADNVLGKNIFELLGLKPAEAATKFQQTKQFTTAQLIEEKITRAGREQRIQVALEALDNEFLAILMDVTEHHEYRSLKERLVAMVIHDLTSPLTTLNLTLELMEDGAFGELNDDLKTRVSNCKNDVNRLTRMMNDLLKLAKYEADQLEIQSIPVPLTTIFSEAIAACGPIAASRGIELHSQCDELTVVADKDRIIQVILNLVTNAVKNAPSGSAVSITGISSDEVASVSVVDRGSGIDPSKLDLIFRPYQQSSWRDSVVKSGTGLGLPICKTIIEAHGGSILATNNDDGGATFSFTLPVAK